MNLSRHFLIACLLVTLGFFASSLKEVNAHHLVEHHQLNCSKDFSCPAELHRRIDFWIQVFRTWGKETAIFHNPNYPEKVYSLVETGEGCSRRVKSQVKKERNRLKSVLYNVASKREAGDKLSKEENHISKLFSEQTPNQIRRAAENIRCQSGVKNTRFDALNG